ncbi:MAG: hypothetical protein DMG92_00700 [Acidobacteria bacterium]|nr:MAG: hypothetical protein DMG92_00700 [Acidobacteriota bacterium]
MMRNLGILILLSGAAVAQTPTAVQTPAAPATVTVGTLQTSQPGKPSPRGAKLSGAAVATASKGKAVSKKTLGTAKTTSVVQKKAVSVNAVAVGKPATAAGKSAAAPAKVSAAAKPASSGPKAAVSVNAPAAKAGTPAPKVASTAKSVSVSASSVKPAAVAGAKVTPKTGAVSVKTASTTVKPVARVQAKPVTVKPVTIKSVARSHGKVAHAKPAVASVGGPKPSPSVQQDKPAAENKPQEFHGRDPFVSVVVAMGGNVGSGCSSGKRCLTIDQIALKGVVKSEAGMIAVVVNAVDKAYFLRENDPVFNGYVVKITGDSIIFKETFHDRLGKALTRDVTKTITRPVA